MRNEIILTAFGQLMKSENVSHLFSIDGEPPLYLDLPFAMRSDDYITGKQTFMRLRFRRLTSYLKNEGYNMDIPIRVYTYALDVQHMIDGISPRPLPVEVPKKTRSVSL